MVKNISNSKVNKRCVKCNELKKIHALGLCNRCYKSYNAQQLVNRSPKKKCECSNECMEMIPSITLRGEERKYADKHFYRSYKNPKYNGGKKTSTSNYPQIKMPWHPNAEKSGYIYTHIWVMSRKIKRPLEKGEVVHHIDGNGFNNHPNNLQLFSSHSEHMTKTTRKNYDGRKCKYCDSETTYVYKGHPCWYGNEKDGFICYICYNLYHRNKKNK